MNLIHSSFAQSFKHKLNLSIPKLFKFKLYFIFKSKTIILYDCSLFVIGIYFKNKNHTWIIMTIREVLDMFPRFAITSFRWIYSLYLAPNNVITNIRQY